MAKYPGAWINNEVGTSKELAKSYGVSERTIYRWKAKARKESGVKPKKPTRPRPATLQNFKGTRKELAKKYGVSERTAYRWLAKAKEKGVNIESRQKASKYPGTEILSDKRKNKEIAKDYGVSERTVSRWKQRAKSQQDFIEKVNDQVEQISDADEFYNDIFSTPEFSNEPEEISDLENELPWEVPEPAEYSETVTQQLNDIGNMLTEFDLLSPDSAFYGLSDEMKTIYLNDYIQHQWDLNPYQFNQSPPDDPNGPDISDPEKIANINIWGDEFETWLKNKIEVDLL